MIKTLRYQFQLNAEQADFLANTSYGHNRMNYFVSLVKRAALKPYPSLVNGSKGTVDIGIVERSIKQLSGDWHLDYKTTKEMLNDMNALGIVVTKSTPQTSTHVLPVVAAWMVDTVCINNPYFARGYDKSDVHVADFDSTAIASEFNLIMEESIANYMDNLPKGGRGKHKSSASKNLILPTIQGLELYGKMLAKAESHSNESDTIADIPASSTTPTVETEGSGSSDTLSTHEEQVTVENPLGDSSNDMPSDTASSDETEESCIDSSVSDGLETPTSVSDDATESDVDALPITDTEEPKDES